MYAPHFLLLAAIVVAPAVAAAQTSPVEQQQQALQKEHHIVYFGDNTSTATEDDYQNLIGSFYLDQFRHAQDPRAPYFLLMSRDAQLAMGVGGTIKALGYYDFDGVVDGTDFAPYLIPIPRNPADNTAFQTSLNQSSLFMSVFGNHKVLGKFQVYLEGNFSGASSTFKMKKAYVTTRDITFGLAKSTFTDPSSMPSTVETEGPNSTVNDTRFLLRYMHQMKNGVAMAISAEYPDQAYETVEGVTANGGHVWLPDFAAFLQYGWAGGQHIRLSGIVRPMRYRNLVKEENGHVVGYGLNLSAIFRPVPALTVMAAGNTGRGIGSMVNDLSFGASDLMSYSGDRLGKMYAPQSFGWYAALQYNFRPNVFSTMIVSQERLLAKDNTDGYGPMAYKYGLYGTANVFWAITPRCEVGAEFNIGKRVNINGDNRLAYRLGLLAQFSF